MVFSCPRYAPGGILSSVFILLLLTILDDMPVKMLFSRVDAIEKALRSFNNVSYSGLYAMADEIKGALDGAKRLSQDVAREMEACASIRGSGQIDVQLS